MRRAESTSARPLRPVRATCAKGASSTAVINVIPPDPDAPSPALTRPAPLAEPAARLPLAEPTRLGGRSEDSWRAEAQRLERKVQSLEADLERAETARSNAFTLSSSAYYERKVKRIEQNLEAARGEIDQLEERARRLEVPPGWLR